jgi:putative ABC transport system permease protein
MNGNQRGRGYTGARYAMHYRDTVRLALGALTSHKMRTVLTLLGLVIGVTSLILVMTLIQGADEYVKTKIANLGTDIFQVSKIPLASANFEAILRARKHPDLTVEDWHAVQEGCRACQEVGAVVSTIGHVRTEVQSLSDVSLRGESANMGAVSTLDIASGRFFMPGEEREAAPVVVLGAEVAERLFEARNPLGETVRIEGAEFTVIGVADKIGSVLGQDQDMFAIIVLPAFEKLFGTRNSLNFQIKASQRMEPAADEVRAILRARRHRGPSTDDDFFIVTAESYMSLWRDISSVFFLVFVLISLVSSIVGGIVIMNITLVSVTERIREIGLRRSVGATRRDIALQFLTEVLAQCVLGGLAGVALGFAFALLLKELTPFPAAVRLWVAAVGLVLASVIAVIFGVYPAIKAARLDPVVALRSE